MIFCRISVNHAWKPDDYVGHDDTRNYSGVFESEEVGRSFFESKLEELYPGQWCRTPSGQYNKHNWRAGTSIMGLFYVEADKYEDQKNKVFRLTEELAEAKRVLRKMSAGR